MNARKTAAKRPIGTHASQADRITHGRGERKADASILNVVAVLLRHGIEVAAACEGHPGDQKRSPTPWIDLERHSQQSPRIVERTLLQLLDAFYGTHGPAIPHVRLCLRPASRLESVGADEMGDITETHTRMERHSAYLNELRAFGQFLAARLKLKK